MKGDYTVNVKGLADEVLTKTATVEDEKVESIEILSDVAVVNQTVGPTSATVGYQVKNQYGEDITKTTSLTTNNTNTNGISANNGVVTIGSAVLGSQPKVGDKVAVALVHAESAKSTTKTVTLSAAASVSEVAVTGIYNKDGKTLNEDTVLSTDAFYLLVEVKDQYGNLITNKTNAANGLIKSETNPTVIKTKGANTSVELEEVTINGKKHLGLKLVVPTTNPVSTTPKAGESQVTLISTTTGKNASYKVKVAETTRADVVNLSSPALAVAKEDILVPVSVMDKDGNAITDVKVLNSAKGVSTTFNSGSGTFIKDKEGNIFIKLTGPNTEGSYALVAQSTTFKVATLTIKVEKEAVPTTIRGLKNPLALAAGKPETLAVKDLVIEDQYGRVMETTKAVAYLNSANKGILIRKADATKDIVTLPDNANPVTTPGSNTIKHDTGVDVTAGSNNGSQVLQFLLAKNDGTDPVAASVAEATVRVTDGTEYTSYEIAKIGLTQAADVESAGVKKITVNGILNGGKVALVQDTDFTATISGGRSTGTATFANNEITVNKDRLNTKKHTDGVTDVEIDTEFTLKVTINATGQVLEQKFTVSPYIKKVVDFYFTNSAIAANHDKADKVTEAVLKSGKKVSEANQFIDEEDAQITIATTDQYGNKAVVAIDADWKVTIVPEKVGQVTITDNGTKDAIATLASGVQEANVTIKLAIGNVVKEIKTVVK